MVPTYGCMYNNIPIIRWKYKKFYNGMQMCWSLYLYTKRNYILHTIYTLLARTSTAKVNGRTGLLQQKSIKKKKKMMQPGETC